MRLREPRLAPAQPGKPVSLTSFPKTSPRSVLQQLMFRTPARSLSVGFVFQRMCEFFTTSDGIPEYVTVPCQGEFPFCFMNSPVYPNMASFSSPVSVTCDLDTFRQSDFALAIESTEVGLETYLKHFSLLLPSAIPRPIISRLFYHLLIGLLIEEQLPENGFGQRRLGRGLSVKGD